MIDWGFISEREGGCRLIGYVPRDPATGDPVAKSGVTIATGFDLGSRAESDLRGLAPDLVAVLVPYLGWRGFNAMKVLQARPLQLQQWQSDAINTLFRGPFTSSLKLAYNLASKAVKFDDLPNAAQTVIASVAEQYGLEGVAENCPKFWAQATSQDWPSMVANLRQFGDIYPTRRNLEADYLEKGINT